MIVYKLTDQKMQTFEKCQWELGVTKEAPGTGPLCTSGWLHCYDDPLIGIMFNPIHGAYINPRLFEGEASGRFREDGQQKCGVQRLTLLRELPVPIITLDHRMRFAILCVLNVWQAPWFIQWVKDFLSGVDQDVGTINRLIDRAKDEINLTEIERPVEELLKAVDFSLTDLGGSAEFYASSAASRLELGTRDFPGLQMKASLIALAHIAVEWSPKAFRSMVDNISGRS